MRRLLRHRDFRLLYLGRVLSMVGDRALWVALEIVNGRKVPKYMKMSATTVTNETVEQYSGLKPGTAVASSYSAQWVRRNLLNQKN